MKQLCLFPVADYELKHGDYLKENSLYPTQYKLLQDKNKKWWALSEAGSLFECSPDYMMNCLGFVKSEAWSDDSMQ
jgi:hypothetical protein